MFKFIAYDCFFKKQIFIRSVKNMVTIDLLKTSMTSILEFNIKRKRC